jgi:hypothetical protein
VALRVAQEVGGVDHRWRVGPLRDQLVEQPPLLQQADVVGLARLA